MGDLNCNTLPSSLNNVNTQALLSIADIFNIKQLITEPTRVTPVSSTLIDVIFTSHPDNVSCSGVSHVGINNHSLIYVFRKISFQSPSRELLLFRIGNLSNDPFKVDSNFLCYAATGLSPHRNVIIFTQTMHKPTGKPLTQ